MRKNYNDENESNGSEKSTIETDSGKLPINKQSLIMIEANKKKLLFAAKAVTQSMALHSLSIANTTSSPIKKINQTTNDKHIHQDYDHIDSSTSKLDDSSSYSNYYR